jgi:hypothetical protein
MNTADILDQLATAVRRDVARNRRRQRLTIALAALMLFALGGVGIAGTYDDWWTDNAPAVQPDQLNEVAQENDPVGIHLDLSKKATVARTGDAELDAIATNGGSGYCLSLFVGAKGMGTSCTTQSDSEYQSRADDTHWIGYGRILDAHAAVLDMSGAGLPARVQLERGGFFLFDIPRSQWDAVDGRSGDISILDEHGRTIRSTCVFVGFAPGSQMAGDGGLGDKPGACAGLRPIVSAPELERATRVVSLTLAHDQGAYDAGDAIALWTAPNRGGGVCWFMSTSATAAHTGGASCASSPTPPSGPGVSSTLVDGHYANLVAGFVDPALGVAKVELVGASETLPVAFADNAVLGELPDAPKAGKEPGPIPGGPWRLVYLDASGREVSSQVLPAR